MRKRKPIKNVKKDKKIFTKTAKKVEKRNLPRTPMRGGIRL